MTRDAAATPRTRSWEITLSGSREKRSWIIRAKSAMSALDIHAQNLAFMDYRDACGPTRLALWDAREVVS